jgi:hypothetical protein
MAQVHYPQHEVDIFQRAVYLLDHILPQPILRLMPAGCVHKHRLAVAFGVDATHTPPCGLRARSDGRHLHPQHNV